jgi:uncharacterized membrane protein
MKLLAYLRREWISLLLMTFPYIVLWFVWDRIPDPMPVHWGPDMQPDRFAPKGIGNFWVPATSLYLFLILQVIPYADPRKKESTLKTLKIIQVATLAFMCLVYLTMILDTAKLNILNTESVIVYGICILLMVIGNFMTKMKSNYVAGVRTPWTLENEETWRQTHRLAAKTFFFGPMALMLIHLVFKGPYYILFVLLPGTLVLAFIPVVYSYFHYQGQKKKHAGTV